MNMTCFYKSSHSICKGLKSSKPKLPYLSSRSFMYNVMLRQIRKEGILGCGEGVYQTSPSNGREVVKHASLKESSLLLS